MNRNLAIITAVMICCCSCSLKEDRTDCPCWLEIDMDSVSAGYGYVTVAAYDSGYIFRDKINTDESPGPYVKTVPKGYIFTSVVSGERNMRREGLNLIIPLGYPCDSIYAHCNLVKCLGETARDTVILRKQHAKVYLKLNDPTGIYREYDLYVSGEVCGMDLIYNDPIAGDFRHLIKIDDENNGRFCLPRQRTDDELVIHICEEKRILETLPLSDWIKSTGYDWQKKNLDDIYIGLDYSRALVNISVADWEGGEVYHIRI